MRIFYFCLALLLPGCVQEQAKITIPSVAPEIVDLDTADLGVLGTYTRAVALETRDACLLGNVDSVKLMANGDLLVMDKSATKSVYRFDRQGRFLNRFGALGQGPGEYETLLDVAVLDNGLTLLVTDGKLLLFRADGTFLRERRVGFVGYFAEGWQDQFYIFVTSGMERVDHTLWVFDQNLNKRKSFHPYDRRFDRVGFLPYNALTASPEHIFISELYDFRLTAYTAAGVPQQAFLFPNDNGSLEGFWQGRGKPDQRSLRQLFQGIHRPITVQAFGDLVYMLEIQNKRQIHRTLILDTRTHKLYRFPNLKPVGYPSAAYLSMDHVAGRFEGGLIGICDSPEQLRRHRDNYDVLKGLTLGETDNPIVLFFLIKHPGKTARPSGA